ncbi:hypothetical protein Lal_00020543 [Lupinus albus]|nr:hypothetical protein Lal_00020543 [Lupinus albus]
MTKKKNPLVFMDVSIDGDPFERMVFELLYDVAPKTAEKFLALCTGEKGISPNTGKSLHYKGSFFHRIVKVVPVTVVYAVGYRDDGHDSFSCDLVLRLVILPIKMLSELQALFHLHVSYDSETSGESIYGSDFSDESSMLKHDAPGLLSMAISDRDTLSSHFIITLKADRHLDRKHAVFGKLVLGHNILKKIEDVGDEEGRPTVTVKIVNCGEYAEARHKGKHKKSSKDRRKRRRRYYLSESESSSDSDMESSETDSDSESDVSSSSDISSSSDDRRRKRKRSRKDKHRHRKIRNKRRDKRQRRRDKRSKRRSRREPGSDSDDEKNRDVSFDGASLDDQGKEQNHKDQGKEQNHKDHSQKNGAKVRSPLVVVRDSHNKDRPVDVPETEEELPKENGKRLTNGIGSDYRFDQREERQPDVMDYHSGKSRSRSMSPKRPMSNSLSISARRSQSKSPSVTPKKRFSRGPAGSRSPPARRSVSRSPVRSISRIPSKSISRSPVRGKKGSSLSRSPARGGKGRSVSRSPVRGVKDRSVSRSPVRSRKGRSISRSPVRSRSLRSVSKSPVRFSSRSRRSSPRASSRKTISRSPVRVSRKGVSRSPVRSPSRSLSRSSGRVSLRRDISRSPVRAPSRSNRRSYSRSPSPVRRTRTPRGRSVSRSVSPAASPRRVRRGRVFSERYSYARRYNTPSWSPVRSYRYNGRDRDRYSSYRRYSPRRYRSPPPRARTPPRFFPTRCTEAGGHHLFPPAHVTMLDAIAEAVARSAVALQLSHILIAPLLVWGGDYHLLGARVHQSPDLRYHNLHEKQAEKRGQGHPPPEAQMERKVWSLMEMVLPTQGKGEICGLREGLGILSFYELESSFLELMLYLFAINSR